MRMGPWWWRAVLCVGVVGATTGAVQVQAEPAPAVLELRVDVSDIDRNIQRVEQSLAVQPGPLTLLYPQWIPGNHAPTGPIHQIAGLTLRGHGQLLRWRRDEVNMYAFHAEIPEGVRQLDVEFQYFSPTAADQGRIATTAQMLALQWHRVLLYPVTPAAAQLAVHARVRLPAGWSFATALEGGRREGDWVEFAATPLETLIDSPLYAARHLRSLALDDAARAPVRLHAMADAPEELEATPAMLAAHRALVLQADRVFGARPFDHYEFLLATSSLFSAIGLEHRQSSENGQPAGYLRGEAPFVDHDLLAHEYVHAWNGKYRRPAPTATPDYNTPMRNALLWMYEGQTQYWAWVLSARAGLRTHEQSLAVLATIVAAAEQRSGRSWRDLQDTVNEGIIEFNDAPQAWEDWQRAYDFYDEGALLWLDVDARLREGTRERRSLDDFARAFFAGPGGLTPTSTYDEAEVVAALTRLLPTQDWHAFLRSRLDAHTDWSHAALARAGWKLVYEPGVNPAIAATEKAQQLRDFSHSLGLRIADADGRLAAVVWGSPAWQAGLARDTLVIGVNDATYSGERLERALASAQRDGAPIRLLVRRGDHLRTVSIPYRGGVRHPHLRRIAGSPDRLERILRAR